MKIADVTALARLPSTGFAACGTTYSGSQVDGTPLHAIVLDLGTDAANVTATYADGSDVPSTKKWVTQSVYTQLDDGITRANSVLSSANSSAVLLDYQT
ncbi:uncharacterized protein EAF01_009830 [Botrytis porri]|uniref:Uncharacterized protein n=1 Tax=Botrytis porri TaxID=87229 RepID=A0A4Z1KQ75_9HELO|nr:uncharacterized protein EAF01_009830 [Botrytis porri]KAF7894379.1 hypothetical protein EAF01_009830 [Botrytis porri]TGO86642.1 hypothetical protein BPOR_0287g00060 [Botrytis porri]